jgi:hypothetical protein
LFCCDAKAGQAYSMRSLLKNIRSAPRFHKAPVHSAGFGPSLIAAPSVPSRTSNNWPREL